MAGTLKYKESDLAQLVNQNDILNNGLFSDGKLEPFNTKLERQGIHGLTPTELKVFQINLGYMCNQTCKHCHVDAGPERQEIMNRQTMEICLEKISEFGVKTVDLTGGAPEMNPDFRWFVTEIRKRNVSEIIVRSNLTIIRSNPKYYDLPEFFKENEVRIISSLPYYHSSKTDRQRGKGVFNKSIEALKMLNEVGYGESLVLDLVYNPGGAFLPGNQDELEREFKHVLMEEHGIVFNELFALTNLPINRFLDYLLVSGNYEDYMEKLVESYNPMAVDGLMCRDTISIDYTGTVYDCDFNQMLELDIRSEIGAALNNLSIESLSNRTIVTGQHCYGCTAGAGSSCQGATTS